MASKELPNTKDVLVWPIGSVPDDHVRPKRRLSVNSNQSSDSDDGEKSIFVLKSKWWGQNVEFSIFFFLGSLIWILSVQYILKVLQFPVHKHYAELLAIYCVPIILVYSLLRLVDIIFPVEVAPQKSSKKLIHNSHLSPGSQKLIN